MTALLPTLTALARRLVGDTDLWRPRVAYDPTTRFSFRLLAEPDHEAWLLTWLPGQGTAWHDHAESAGSFVVVQGSLREEVAGVVADGWEPRLDHRLDLGDQRSFGRRYVHRVTNVQTEPAISLHVYGPRLTRMTEYTLHDGALRPGQAQLAGVDW